MAVKPVYTITVWSCDPKEVAPMGTGTAMSFLSPRDCIRSQDLQDRALHILRGTVFLAPSPQPPPHPVKKISQLSKLAHCGLQATARTENSPFHQCKGTEDENCYILESFELP